MRLGGLGLGLARRIQKHPAGFPPAGVVGVGKFGPGSTTPLATVFSSADVHAGVARPLLRAAGLPSGATLRGLASTPDDSDNGVSVYASGGRAVTGAPTYAGGTILCTELISSSVVTKNATSVEWLFAGLRPLTGHTIQWTGSRNASGTRTSRLVSPQGPTLSWNGTASPAVAVQGDYVSDENGRIAVTQSNLEGNSYAYVGACKITAAA